MSKQSPASISFDAIPVPTFIVDDDVRIASMNQAARTFLGGHEEPFRDRRGGEVLNCIRAKQTPEGCGSATSCESCLIRASVRKTVGGASVTRSRTVVQVTEGDSVAEMELLITTSPYSEGQVVLMIEDITEVAALRALVPICMDCKKIRKDDNFWDSIEEYLAQKIGVDLSHGLCPTCFEKRVHEANDTET
ncbi:PAS domain-containing protein [Geomesophilobacter sediminis]|uniref:PAS domain-containing protein n=1 Tax=Geomesophilobacter sediminis TaxID=2798584 RepID=A0A8J7LYZ2_9BACT|nr:PAS domain-containing protein [Geomesophilobacter sediminis]MBJ6725782.1 PAS domain-containing protein [Geomesophilobacter sediminis]